MHETNYHPVYLDLRGRHVLIVGGGEIAVEKIRTLLESGALLRVVAPEAVPAIRQWHGEAVLVWEEREFQPADVENAFLSIGATDDLHVNRQVADLANAQNRLGNSVDDPGHCNFIMAAIARKGAVQVAVSSAGASPALAQRIRNRILDEVLTDEMGDLANFMGAWRPEVGRSLPTYQDRRQFWEAVLDSDIPRTLTLRGRDAADREMRAMLSGRIGSAEERVGKVFLVGAGPGDARLLTVRAVEALRHADVVLYDRLIAPEVLRHCSIRAERLCVGKFPDSSSTERQESIHTLMIEHARAGRTVVRLKGGDPFVFGRGGEEAMALADAGIEFEVVPGISSAITAAAAALIPVTHRGVSDGFTVVTGRHEHDEPHESDAWRAAAQSPTAVFLMGLERLSTIVEFMIDRGRPADTPVAVVSNATLPTQKVVTGTLDTIVGQARGVSSPAVIVIGKVVATRARLIRQNPQLNYAATPLVTNSHL